MRVPRATTEHNTLDVRPDSSQDSFVVTLDVDQRPALVDLHRRDALRRAIHQHACGFVQSSRHPVRVDPILGSSACRSAWRSSTLTPSISRAWPEAHSPRSGGGLTVCAWQRELNLSKYFLRESQWSRTRSYCGSLRRDQDGCVTVTTSVGECPARPTPMS